MHCCVSLCLPETLPAQVTTAASVLSSCCGFRSHSWALQDPQHPTARSLGAAGFPGEEPLRANPLLSPCWQLEGLERNETELNTIEAKKLAHRLRAVTDHMEHYFGNDVHITYRLLSRLMAFESRQRGFGLTATQDAHFNEVRPSPASGRLLLLLLLCQPPVSLWGLRRL